MARAMMVKTRSWLAGEVSAQRDMALIRCLIERVRTCALRHPLLLGWPEPSLMIQCSVRGLYVASGEMERRAI